MRRSIKLFLLLCLYYSRDIDGQNRESKQKVAIIGGGAAGLTTAWLLEQDYNVTLYERQDRLGGHAQTVHVNVDGQTYPVDAGFEFFTDSFFPYFSQLLKILHVPTRKFPLTYTFYKTDGSKTLVLPPIHNGQMMWRCLWPYTLYELIQFKWIISAGKPIVDSRDTTITMEQFVEASSWFTSSFKNDFFYPFMASAWGISIEGFKSFAAYDIMKWLVKNEPANIYSVEWNEIVGGTSEYIKLLVSHFENVHIKLSVRINDITFANDQYWITDEQGHALPYDHLILATEANQASRLLKNVVEASSICHFLEQIEYYDTIIAIHGDSRLMPKNPSDWSVVNIRYDDVNSQMTMHKPWIYDSLPLYRSWMTFDVGDVNMQEGSLPNPLYKVIHYNHFKPTPYFFHVQKIIEGGQGNNRLWFVGLYTYDIDSHESAIVSAIKVAERLAPSSIRLHQLLSINPIGDGTNN